MAGLDRVAAVAADTPEIAQRALELIDVDYEPLPFYTDVETAAREGAYPIHGESNVITTMVHNAGDLEAGFQYVHAAAGVGAGVGHDADVLGHQGAVVFHAYTGKLTIISPNQNVFGYRIILSRIFGLPMSRVRVSSPARSSGAGAAGRKRPGAIRSPAWRRPPGCWCRRAVR